VIGVLHTLECSIQSRQVARTQEHLDGRGHRFNYLTKLLFLLARGRLLFDKRPFALLLLRLRKFFDWLSHCGGNHTLCQLFVGGRLSTTNHEARRCQRLHKLFLGARKAEFIFELV
jgi:hypothetical protein